MRSEIEVSALNLAGDDRLLCLFLLIIQHYFMSISCQNVKKKDALNCMQSKDRPFITTISC